VARRYSRYVWWKGNAAGPRPKRRGPKSGERVGGVCPEDDEWAVRRARREIILNHKRESTLCIKTWRRKSLTKFGLTPLDVHIPREEASHGIAPRDTHDSGEISSQTYGKFCGRSKVGLLVSAQRPAQGTRYKYGGKLG